MNYLVVFFRQILLGLVLVGSFFLPQASHAWGVEYVVQVSVDGLGPSYLQPQIDAGLAPNFKRFQTEGAWTNNARTDFDFTITLPNHTCMLTGRPVRDKEIAGSLKPGHQWTENGEPAEATLHSNRHAYVASVFDVAHDRGLSTALYASKTKFVLFPQSYNGVNGAPDELKPDHGRNKIDTAFYNANDSIAMMAKLSEAMKTEPRRYTFIHYHDTDTAGHAEGWGNERYIKAIHTVDKLLGELFAIAESEPLRGNVAIVLTADHGGRQKNHADVADPLDYTIPFYVWGAGVARGQDLYELNPTTRKNPQGDRLDYTASELPPIRNGDSGNLSLKLLGLPAIPDSAINAQQDLGVSRENKAPAEAK